MPFSSSTLLRLTFALSFFTPTLLSSASHSHYRRILHQPFFPLDSLPPTQSPNHSPPAPVTPFPFTASSPADNPFFPETSIPPPPPPPSPDTTNTATTYSTIPANVSSLSFPQVPKSSKPASSKLILGAVAAVIAAIIVVSISAFLHFRRRSSGDSNDTKTHRSDNSSVLHHTSTGNSSNIKTIPKLQRPTQLSSEFLYLGTLVNAHDTIDKASSYPLPNSCTSNNPAESSTSNPKRVGSPELRPLPPLNRKDFRRNDVNSQLCSCSEDDDDDNEFHSPKRSRRGRDNSIGHFAAVQVGNFSGSCSCSSYSSSSSTSGSPVRSISLSTSPPASLSPERSRLKSPELINVQLTPQQPLPSTDFPRGSFSKSPSPPPNLASLTRANSITSPGQQPSGDPLSVPSPPPPPPPLPLLQPWNKQCEIPRNPTPQDRGLGYDSSVSVMPSRPISLESPTLISPIQLPPLYTKDVEKNESILDSKESPDGNVEKNVHNPRPKLKPLHWDKVRASSDREMVWDQLMSNSFKLNEEMIETLFVMNAPIPSTQRPVLPLPSKEKRVLDPKKSQNISILLKALNVSVDEVCEALLEGRAENLGSELLEILLKMTPTKEEERKLKEHKDDSPVKLGPAEKFLKAVLEIPFAFRRMEALLYISSFWYEVEYLKKSLETLEAACEELRNSRIFLKLLEAVLKTGNRMNIGTNRGDASAFKLDTLLKLVDVKGADGKTTLLHFVVQEIIKREGARICTAHQSNRSSDNDDPKWQKLGLQVVSALGSELMNVKKAAAMDSESLNSDVFKLANGLGNVAEVVRLVEGTRMENSGNPIFSESINGFLIMAEEEIIKIQAQESVALSLVKEITEYFHGNSTKEEAHPLRIFMVVRDFLTILDRVSKEVGLINERTTTISSASKFPIPVNPTLQQSASIGFPHARQLYSSSDDESSSA